MSSEKITGKISLRDIIKQREREEESKERLEGNSDEREKRDEKRGKDKDKDRDSVNNFTSNQEDIAYTDYDLEEISGSSIRDEFEKGKAKEAEDEASDLQDNDGSQQGIYKASQRKGAKAGDTRDEKDSHKATKKAKREFSKEVSKNIRLSTTQATPVVTTEQDLKQGLKQGLTTKASLEALLTPKLGNNELRDLICKGCRDENRGVSRYYLFWVAESIGLGSDRLDSISSSFEGFKEIDFSNWDNAVETTEELAPKIENSDS